MVTKEGMRVGVREVGNEKEVGGVQRWAVRAWEFGGSGAGGVGGVEKRRWWEREGKEGGVGG